MAVAARVADGADPNAAVTKSDYSVMAMCLTLLVGVIIGAVLVLRRTVIGSLKRILGRLEPNQVKTKADQGAQVEPDNGDGNFNEPKNEVMNDALDGQLMRVPDVLNTRIEFDGMDAKQPRPVEKPPGLHAGRRLGYTGSDRGMTNDGIIGTEC